MEEKLRIIFEKNETAYNLTGTVYASGEELDCLAAARQEMRNIKQILSDLFAELRKEEKDG